MSKEVVSNHFVVKGEKDPVDERCGSSFQTFIVQKDECTVVKCRLHTGQKRRHYAANIF